MEKLKKKAIIFVKMFWFSDSSSFPPTETYRNMRLLLLCVPCILLKYCGHLCHINKYIKYLYLYADTQRKKTSAFLSIKQQPILESSTESTSASLENVAYSGTPGHRCIGLGKPSSQKVWWLEVESILWFKINPFLYKLKFSIMR